MSFREAFFFWLKLGFVSFGGPAGQIALMHEALVTRRKIFTEGRFLNALNFCMLLPGPEAQQLATYLGWLMHRTWGGLVAGGLFVLPSFFILVGISTLYVLYGHLPLVEGLFAGIKPAVLALVLFASYRMGSKILKSPGLWGIALASWMATAYFAIAFPWVVLTAAFLGFVGQRYAPQYFGAASGHGAAIDQDDNALSALPQHMRFSRSRMLWVLVIGGLAWLLPMGLLLGFFGIDHPLSVMGLFFSKAAMLTFGGAYAVLPYVFDASVHQYHWLTLPQMMDGMGLGETTPGPLIMIVTYVGFVGGYLNDVLHWGSPFLSGLMAALVATWFTFLPSFVFIFVGGPFIETTHQNLSWALPLSAITAAVVGVILSLAFFFGSHLILGDGIFNLQALLLTLAALVALIRFKIPSIPVIFVSAILGSLLH